MGSAVPGFEYDIFISYRHNDNLDGWVTEFVQHLDKALKSTLKEPLSIYFDKDPHDGLLETHQVGLSLKGKLRCLIFIPIISQTYCDKMSFAWQNEFCAFHRLTREDQFGRDVRLANGNVASRILPIKIHNLDPEDNHALEEELNGPLRAIEFIYSEPGVNRPLNATDNRIDNLHKTDFRNQVNKTANAIKDLIFALRNSSEGHPIPQPPLQRKKKLGVVSLVMTLVVLLLLVAAATFLAKNSTSTRSDEVTQALDRADMYLEEAGRFDDQRYTLNAIDAARKVLIKYPSNERAIYLLAVAIDNNDSTESFRQRLIKINDRSIYALLLEAGLLMRRHDFASANTILGKAEEIDPGNKDLLQMLSFSHLVSGNYMEAWTYARRYENTFGKGAYNILSSIYLELGDFKEARLQLEKKQVVEEFSCGDIENYQRVLLCEGNFERLERMTDSICALTKCDQCSFWRLRAKMHVRKFTEASKLVHQSLDENNKITWRYPAFVLYKVGKDDSARLVSQAEQLLSRERLADTTYNQALPLYSLSAINAMQGNFDESLKWLRLYADRGFEMGSEWYISHDPLFDDMQKNNEHFADFIQIVQKAQAQKSAIREKLRDLEQSN